MICDGCQAHYASIREGRYHEHQCQAEEEIFLFHSWISVGTPTEKKVRREDKVKQKRGLFSKKVAVPPPEEEAPPPPPDWKNRVFPSGDSTNGDAGEDQETPTEPSAETAELVVGSSDTGPATSELEAEKGYEAGDHLSFSYGLEDTEADRSDADAVESGDEPALADHAIETTVPRSPEPVIEDEPPPAPAPELASFFDSLGSVTPPAPEVQSEVVSDAPTLPAPQALTDFFSSFNTPAVPPIPPEVEPPAADAVPGADLASFFDSLGTTSTPDAKAGEPQASAPDPVSLAPVAADLSDFFASFSTPTEVSAPADAPVSPIEPEPDIVGMAPVEIAPVEAAPRELTPMELAFQNLDFTARPRQEPAPEASPADLLAPPISPAEPFSGGTKPFEIQIEMPGAAGKSGASAGGASKSAGADRPPVHGKPFEIDLGETPTEAPPLPPPPPPPRSTRKAEEFKKQSMGGLSFVSDDDEDEDEGLLSGLTFHPSTDSPPYNDASHRAARDDDDDDGSTTLEL